MNILESLTPKNIILKVLTEKLEGTGIIKMTLIFPLENDHYNIMLSNKDGSKMKLDITEDEITTIKKLFVSRIEKAWKREYDIVINCIIIQIDISKKELEIFVQDLKNDILKFEYK